MTNIPEHVRRNHEKTSERLDEARAMLRAVEQMAEAARLPHSPETESMFVLIAATQEATDNATLKRWASSLGDLLDPSLYQPVQPHFLSAPFFVDPSMDPFKTRSRLLLIGKNRRTVPVGFLNEFKTPMPSKRNKEGMIA